MNESVIFMLNNRSHIEGIETIVENNLSLLEVQVQDCLDLSTKFFDLDDLNPMTYLEEAWQKVKDFFASLMGQVFFYLIIAAICIGVCIAIYCM